MKIGKNFAMTPTFRIYSLAIKSNNEKPSGGFIALSIKFMKQHVSSIYA